jgi:thiol:disulfide interchange protein
MKAIHRLFAASVAAMTLATAARAADWTEDYSAGLAQAKKEHKLLVLDFTGSDWCVWCKRTDQEVFSTQKFKDFADQNLVLVRVDFPRAVAQSDAVKAQNAKLQDKYQVEGYPTLIVLDPNEKVVAKQVGYREGGPEAFIAQLPKQGS